MYAPKAGLIAKSRVKRPAAIAKNSLDLASSNIDFQKENYVYAAQRPGILWLLIECDNSLLRLPHATCIMKVL